METNRETNKLTKETWEMACGSDQWPAAAKTTLTPRTLSREQKVHACAATLIGGCT